MTAAIDNTGSSRVSAGLTLLRRVLVVAAAIAVVKLVLVILGDHHVVETSTPLPVVVLGAIVGLTYGLLAVGLVLIYRTNKIVNFAHGQIGAFAAAFFGLAAVKWHVPYWVAFPLALLAGAGTGAIAETGVVRRLRGAPRLMSVVATLGVGQFLVIFALVINAQANAGSEFPQPAGFPAFNIGTLRVTPAYSGMLLLSPVIVAALTVFLRRSRFGMAMRAASSNTDLARLSGIFAARTSTLAWAIAGALSAFTAILTQPTQGFTSIDAFGPSLLLRAMTGAVIARMSNLPVALFAGVGLGVVEQVLLWNYPQSGLVEVTLFVVILGALLLQRGDSTRGEDRQSWAAVAALRPLPDELRRIWPVRHLGTALGVAGIAGLAVLPLLITNSASVSVTEMMALAIVGFSVGMLTGLGGQLTLGQFGVAAVGAVISFQVSRRIGEFPLAFLYAGLGAGAVSVLVGLPSLRVRGLMLTVTSLSFALATPAWLLVQPWAFGDGRDPGQPVAFGHALTSGRSYYYVGLVVFVVCLVLVRNLRRSGFGRLLVAVRDNEDAARAFAIPSGVVKLQGYFASGFVAGLGGAMYAHSLSSVDASTFPASLSITVVVMTVLGGISAQVGPILGALYIVGIPTFVPLNNAGLAATQLGALLVIIQVPGGILHMVEPLRLRAATLIGRLWGVTVTAEAAEPEEPTEVPSPRAEAVVSRPLPAAARPALLRARNLHKSYDGVTAVDGVSIDVGVGEIVGLIGPNGAGKTTTFELLSGFVRPDRGVTVFDGRDVSALRPDRRAGLGLVRSFQDAALFPTMTVTETVMVSLERSARSGLLTAASGWPGPDGTKRREARDLVGAFGLDPYRDRQIQQLSTGTRRIVEIVCLVALRPRLLLLDEPSSGIAQRDTEALGTLLASLNRDLGMTLFVIEHDIPLITSLAERIVAMADGKVIADGAPSMVQQDPRVIESYLGGSIVAISRSGAAPGTPRRRRRVPAGGKR